jgi:hypothetical protein
MYTGDLYPASPDIRLAATRVWLVARFHEMAASFEARNHTV